jgi:hypothetical protein
MKITTKLLLLVLVIVCFGCLFTIGIGSQNNLRDQYREQVESVLEGEHPLRKMAERSETNSTTSGNFFMFAGIGGGGISGESKTDIYVKFAWKMNDGDYALSSLPFEKIRVRFDEKIVTPNIKFRWHRWTWGRVPEIQELMEKNISYAIITVKESDWPIQVNLPLNEK